MIKMNKGNTSNSITASTLYRMPWTMSDNGFSWLEPTRNCNLSCEYCYQRQDPASHQSLSQIELALERTLMLRKCDTMIIAGGEPLTHPGITDITGMVKRYGTKPVILTNGVLLTPSLVRELKSAGVYGFIFHVDSHQNRPGWEGANEKELNSLRQHYTDMISDEGGLVCGFNSTILPETLNEVSSIVQWTLENIRKVASNILIPVRTAHPEDPWRYFAGTREVDLKETPYASRKRHNHLTALDICRQIWKVYPDYTFHSYLGGTVVPDAPKWLFGTHIGSGKGIYGNLHKKTSEILQAMHHLFFGTYLSITPPRINSNARLLLPFAVFDRGIRKSFLNRWRACLKDPSRIFEKISIQSIIVMQPHDYLPNGEQDECDGCPNKTFWNGRLVSECRKEDYILYGRPILTESRPES